MQIAVIGTGYVGLVTGVCLAEVGHRVVCIDIDADKVRRMSEGHSPIYEPQLEELMRQNLARGRLSFTASHADGLHAAEAVYIAVGTPPLPDGTADLSAIEAAAIGIAQHIRRQTVIVTKSTVPVGTNERIRRIVQEHLTAAVPFEVVSNPEFLREGSAVHDAFHGDRIVIGADNDEAAMLVARINEPFGLPIFRTDLRTAELIKYASNAFLATKISFINEIANLCEKLGANVEDVAAGMGMDKRIGPQFLRAGIGYGGSCFPKDTKALVQIAGDVEHRFELLSAVIEVNNKQQGSLVRKAQQRFGTLQGKRVAVLGLAFKPNTDDMREAASIVVTSELVAAGAEVVAYDPIAMEKAKRILPAAVSYAGSALEALGGAACALLLTEWSEFREADLMAWKRRLKAPILFDGRNCFIPEEMARLGFEYHSIGRPSAGMSVDGDNVR